MLREISINGAAPVEVQLTRSASGARLWLDAKPMDATFSGQGDDRIISVDGLSAVVSFVVDRARVLVHAFGRTWRVTVTDPAERALLAGDQSDIAKAPMPGVTISVLVAIGDAVIAGQTLLIIESMKMQMEIKASRAGTIDQINAREGESFTLGSPLVMLAPLEDAGA